METQMLINSALIGTGALIMLFCIFRATDVLRSMQVIDREHRRPIRLSFTLHRSLMVFFLLGYVASIAAIFMQYPLLSETFVSCIFLFGSVFVYTGIIGQRQLLEELSRVVGESDREDEHEF